MELASGLSATLPGAPRFLFASDNKLLLPSRNQFREIQFHFKPKSSAARTRNRNQFLVASSEKKQLYVSKEDEIEEDEEEEDETEDEVDDETEDEDEEEDEEEYEGKGLLGNFGMGELDISSDPNHRSGYVAVLGKPNVGKSTLINQLIGQKFSIVTDKPQTTRHRILGICSAPEYQMILYDTPGVIEKKMHKLDSMMMKNVRNATINADCVLVLVDGSKTLEKIDLVLAEGIADIQKKLPTLLVMNKTDLLNPGEIAMKVEWYEKFTDAEEVMPVSAKYGHGVEYVKQWIISKLPLGPAYYPKDIISEHPERFFVGEIVREKIFLQYRNEIPYACQVNVVDYKERSTAKDYIQVEIVVERSSQKNIIIGKEGQALKSLATAARLDIEEFLQKKVYLQIEVRVKEKWRQNEKLLKRYGYGGEIRVY